MTYARNVPLTHPAAVALELQAVVVVLLTVVERQEQADE